MAAAITVFAPGCTGTDILLGSQIFPFDPPPTAFQCTVWVNEQDGYALADRVDDVAEPAMFGDAARDGTNLYAHGYAATRPEGGTLTLSVSRRTVDPAVAEPFLLGLRFYDSLFDPAGGLPDPEALRTYFTPGREFEVGVGEGKVRFGILLPTTETGGKHLRSRSDLLTTPGGNGSRGGY